MWTRYEGFLKLVQQDWSRPTEAEGLLNLQIKLARVKKALKQRNKDVFGNIHANVKRMEEDIASAQEEYEESPSPENRTTVNKLIASYILLLKMEEDFLEQKATLRWLAEGDKNTRFYQSWVKQKRIRMRIHKVKVNRREVTDETEIKESAVDFYKNLLAPEPMELVEPDLGLLQRLPPSAHVEILFSPPDAEEIKRAVFDISGYSAPGPDGFTATFCQACWGSVGMDVMSAIRQFFLGASSLGALPRQV